MIRFQVRYSINAVLACNSAVHQRCHLEIADQVAGARRGILRPGHPGVEAGHPHLKIALVVPEDRQVSEWLVDEDPSQFCKSAMTSSGFEPGGGVEAVDGKTTCRFRRQPFQI
jgi:hypothetical protein